MYFKQVKKYIFARQRNFRDALCIIYHFKFLKNAQKATVATDWPSNYLELYWQCVNMNYLLEKGRNSKIKVGSCWSIDQTKHYLVFPTLILTIDQLTFLYINGRCSKCSWHGLFPLLSVCQSSQNPGLVNQ